MQSRALEVGVEASNVLIRDPEHLHRSIDTGLDTDGRVLEDEAVAVVHLLLFKVLCKTVARHKENVGVGLSIFNGGIIAAHNHVEQSEQVLVVGRLEVEVLAVG